MRGVRKCQAPGSTHQLLSLKLISGPTSPLQLAVMRSSWGPNFKMFERLLPLPPTAADMCLVSVVHGTVLSEFLKFTEGYL